MECDLNLPVPAVNFSGHVDAREGGTPVKRLGKVPLRTWRIAVSLGPLWELVGGAWLTMGGAWFKVGLGVGLGVARRNSARGRCSFLAVT